MKKILKVNYANFKGKFLKEVPLALRGDRKSDPGSDFASFACFLCNLSRLRGKKSHILFNASLFVRRRGAALAIEGIVKAEASLKFFPLKPDFYSDVVFAWLPERNDKTIKDAFLKKLKAAIDQKDGSQKT